MFGGGGGKKRGQIKAGRKACEDDVQKLTSSHLKKKKEGKMGQGDLVRKFNTNQRQRDVKVWPNNMSELGGGGGMRGHRHKIELRGER